MILANQPHPDTNSAGMTSSPIVLVLLPRGITMEHWKPRWLFPSPTYSIPSVLNTIVFTVRYVLLLLQKLLYLGFQLRFSVMVASSGQKEKGQEGNK